jgi:surface antigen
MPKTALPRLGAKREADARFRRHRRAMVLIGTGLALAACQAPTNQQIGGVTGSAVGAMVGNQFGSGAGRVGATVLGAGVGGLVGSQIGRSLDENARRRAEAAEAEALASPGMGAGVPVSWEAGSSHGTVIPGPVRVVDGRECRPYTHRIVVDGRGEQLRGTACRMPDGSWRSLT